ncbi:MAG: cysteine desulfurase [Crocinitomicaceae bacterium]|nr:cysteine desulfurase [Crocinitomicaceae bacterium]
MQVYLDNAATTPMAEEVIHCMAKVMREDFGNPSSTHFYGRKTKGLLETARRAIAATIHAQPSEIIFTSGGTEADNMALQCAVDHLDVTRIITTPIEHHAVLHTAEFLRDKKNVKLEFVELDNKGNVNLNHLAILLANNKHTTLVSLMHANNEIGTLLDIHQVGQLCRKHGAYFHSDTVQTMGHYAFNMQELQVDFLTCAAHKLHGPKGVGFLYVNKKIKPIPLIHGGAQERGYRGGTENIYGIIGMAEAMKIANHELQSHQKHIQALKQYMMSTLQDALPDVHFNGETSEDKSLYTVLNVCLPPSEKSGILLFTLDLKGVACSGGSACSSGSNKGSHVLAGIHADTSRPNVRFSFSRYTTKAEIDYAVGVLKEVYTTQIA